MALIASILNPGDSKATQVSVPATNGSVTITPGKHTIVSITSPTTVFITFGYNGAPPAADATSWPLYANTIQTYDMGQRDSITIFNNTAGAVLVTWMGMSRNG